MANKSMKQNKESRNRIYIYKKSIDSDKDEKVICMRKKNLSTSCAGIFGYSYPKVNINPYITLYTVIYAK